jgi:transcription-repair coupling factor (superfamily II helicase)
MLLPFVRELFTDVELLPGFWRVASHLKEGTGRIRVSGLFPPQKRCCWSFCGARGGAAAFILVVNDNRAIEDFVPCCVDSANLPPPAIRNRLSGCPRATCCPSRIFRPIPNFRRSAPPRLWKIATGKAGIVVTPIAATAILQRSAEYYTDLARTLRRGESFDLDNLLGHLNTVGYSSADVVEMPGEYAVRGGILDVYPRGRAPRARRVLRRRSRLHPPLRSRLAAFHRTRLTKRCCCL